LAGGFLAAGFDLDELLLFDEAAPPSFWFPDDFES